MGREVVVREGSQTAKTGLGAVYEAHAAGALRFAYLLTHDRELARDLVQDAFVRLAGRFEHVRNPESMDAYIRKTVVNLASSHARRRRMERTHLEAQANRPVTGADDQDFESRSVLWAAILALPTRQRAAVVLRFYEDLSVGQVAQVLGVSAGTVKASVAKAMTKLRPIITLEGGNSNE